MNRLLERQLHKCFPNGIPEGTDFKCFLGIVEAAYNDFDEDSKMVERSLDISSKELRDMNRSLKIKNEEQENLISEIRGLVVDLGIEGLNLDNALDPAKLLHNLRTFVHQTELDARKLKRLYDNSSDIIGSIGKDGTLRQANLAFTRITGISTESAINNSIFTILPESEHFTVQQALDKLNFSDKDIEVKLETVVKNSAGESVIIDWRISKYNTNEDYYFVARDVTRNVLIEKTKTEFVSLASHQLRTPLSAIKWYVNLIKKNHINTDNPKLEEHLGIIYESTQRMIDLVNALLNVSRLELGTFNEEVEEFNVLEVANQIIEDIKPTIDEKGHFVNYDIPEGLSIKMDKTLFIMIMQNLVMNSVKYTPDGGYICFKVSTDEEFVHISVSDNGYGIPKHQHDKMFTKLFRADNIRKKDTTGTGLGMYMIKLIVDKMNGNIRFVSEENKGTTFFIKLPRKR